MCFVVVVCFAFLHVLSSAVVDKNTKIKIINIFAHVMLLHF